MQIWPPFKRWWPFLILTLDIFKDMHFEDIWNEAEGVAAKFPVDVTNRERIIARLQSAVDLLEREEMETLAQQEVLVGNVLFDLAAYCMMMERDCDTQINSARALKGTSDERKVALLDPDPGD